MAKAKNDHHPGVGNFLHGRTKSPNLPPIGVFWDIENCQVPKGKSAMATAQLIRKRFFDGHQEAEFMCVCDISKESKEIIQELNNAQVTVVHINATGKNAADDKLRQSMRRFADIHGSPSTIILISGDVNFAADLSDFNHRRHIRIIVLHNNYAPEPLLACAHFHLNFGRLLCDLPFRTPVRSNGHNNCELLVTKLPTDHSFNQIRSRLKQLSDNCGGRVLSVNHSTALIRFPTPEAAHRARKRMSREDVYGSKIAVNFINKQDCTDSPYTSTPAAKRMNYQENGRSQSPSKSRSPKVNREIPCISPERRRKTATGTVFPPPPNTTLLGPTCWERNSPKQSRNPSYSSPYFNEENIATNNFDPVSFLPNPAALSLLQMSGNVDERLQQIQSIPHYPYFQIANGCCQRQSPIPTETNTQAQLRVARPSRRRVKSASQSVSRSSNISPFNNLNPQSWSKNQDRPRCFDNLPSSQSAPRNGSRRSSSGSQSPAVNDFQVDEPVDLIVSNLDQGMEMNKLKEELAVQFRVHVKVLDVNINLNPDGTLTAYVKVKSEQDAHLAISQLHRKKLGNKRILISMDDDKKVPSHILKRRIHALLKDVPTHSLQLFKFMDLFRTRHGQSLAVSDLSKMKDLVTIRDDRKSRVVSLNEDYRETPSPANSEASKEVESIMESSFCELHCPNPNDGKGWAEKQHLNKLPDVRISLKILAPRLNSLIESHGGSLPLGSLPACYTHEYGPFPTDSTVFVSLEHLITCIPDVIIVTSATGSKRVTKADKSEPYKEFRTISPPLAPSVQLFSREVVDLLKNFENCLLPFVKFIPAYHHHFGRQCRVSDYGYTKLIELLEAVSHHVQVLGEGSKRLLTISHRSQIKRFTSDILRVLKQQASKQVSLQEFPAIYKKTFQKDFKITNYGVCEFSDMLEELPEHTVMVIVSGNDTIISMPRRDQTLAEIERTKIFAVEVIELMSHSPQCRMAFSKFIPAYHHHFGQQCRVSDYGFTKLHDLFDAIPHVVRVLGDGDDKVLVLEEQELIKVLTKQITDLIKSSKNLEIPLQQLMTLYTRTYGHSIHLDDFQVADEFDLMSKIGHAVKVDNTSNGHVLVLIDDVSLREMCLNCRRMLMEQPLGSLPVEEFNDMYLQRYGQSCNIAQLVENLHDYIEIGGSGSSARVILRPLQFFARNVHILLDEYKGRIPVFQFTEIYQQRFDPNFSPTDFEYTNLAALLMAIQEIAFVRGKGPKKTLVLTKEFFNSKALLLASTTQHENAKQFSNEITPPHQNGQPSDLMKCSPLDLLNLPVPSCVPSPSLRPNQLNKDDLIRFDSPVDVQDVNQGPSKPRAVTQDFLATELRRTLNLGSGDVFGATADASAPNSNNLQRITKSPVQQLHWPLPLVTSSTNGKRNQNGNLKNENNAYKSCENLVIPNEGFSSASESSNLSSQSTPTHQAMGKTRVKSRIAANFSQKVGL